MKVVFNQSPANFDNEYDGVDINRDDGGVGVGDESVMMLINMMVMM